MTEGVCKEHSGVCANMSNIQKQVDLHSTEIRTVGDAVIKLTTLLEEMAKSKIESVPSKATPFWDMETKKFTIRLVFIFAVLAMFLIAGINLANQFPDIGSLK